MYGDHLLDFSASGSITFHLPTTGEDARFALTGLQEQYRETGSLKIHYVTEERTPDIYRHTLNAFRKGKPNLLHYDPDRKRQNKRRYEATNHILHELGKD